MKNIMLLLVFLFPAVFLSNCEQAGGMYIWGKAMAIWFNGNQLVSAGNLEIHGKIRPVGSQNEGFIQANWNGSPGFINDWLVAWPGAFRLETLRRLENWDELALEN